MHSTVHVFTSSDHYNSIDDKLHYGITNLSHIGYLLKIIKNVGLQFVLYLQGKYINFMLSPRTPPCNLACNKILELYIIVHPPW